jgi:hypothetical protein
VPRLSQLITSQWCFETSAAANVEARWAADFKVGWTVSEPSDKIELSYYRIASLTFALLVFSGSFPGTAEAKKKTSKLLEAATKGKVFTKVEIHGPARSTGQRQQQSTSQRHRNNISHRSSPVLCAKARMHGYAATVEQAMAYVPASSGLPSDLQWL